MIVFFNRNPASWLTISACSRGFADSSRLLQVFSDRCLGPEFSSRKTLKGTNHEAMENDVVNLRVCHHLFKNHFVVSKRIINKT